MTSRNAAVAAWRSGMRRVNRAPLLLLGAWALTLVVSLPLALGLRSTLAQDLGESLASESTEDSRVEWLLQVQRHTSGLAATFRPDLLGFSAVLDNLNSWFESESRPRSIVIAAAAYLLAWVCMAGGVINRYASEHTATVHGFWHASMLFLVPVIKLEAMAAAAYAVAFTVLRPWLFDLLYPAVAQGSAAESTAFAVRVAFAGVFTLAVAAVNIVSDYAKISTVVERRPGATGALLSSFRFLRTHVVSAALVYGANAALFGLIIVGYALMSPALERTGTWLWLGTALGQLYILGRVWVKLTIWASETRLFQEAAPAPATR
jgi:hypothetical protein